MAEDGLEMSLCAPVSERHATRAGRTRAIVECWLSGDPTPSWRRLVWALEECWECQTADKVKPNVEPLTGEYCMMVKVSSGIYFWGGEEEAQLSEHVGMLGMTASRGVGGVEYF